jgi:hypothetical protein
MSTLIEAKTVSRLSFRVRPSLPKTGLKSQNAILSFFRVRPTGEHRVSLVANHVAPREESARPPLSPDYTSKLLQLAVELHDRELRRAQRWHVWVPLIVALTAGAFTLFGIWLKSVLGGA